MLEILLELLFRGMIGLFRVCLLAEYIGHMFLGSVWLISPSFRRKVRDYDTLERLAVYFGAICTAIGLSLIGLYFLTR